MTLGLCSQIDLDFEVQRAAKEKPVDRGAARRCCRPPSRPLRRKPRPRPSRPKKPADELNVDAVFAKLKQLGKQRRQGRVERARALFPLSRLRERVARREALSRRGALTGRREPGQSPSPTRLRCAPPRTPSHLRGAR